MLKNACIAITVSSALIAAAFSQSAAAREERGGVAGANIPELDTVRVASSMSMPLFVTSPPGDLNRAFIVEQRVTGTTTGRIRILDLTTNPPTVQPAGSPFFTVSPVSTGDEQGLLGLAFHPDFLNNGYFWVNYTNPTTQIVRYQANPPFATSTTANLASATPMFSISQPFTNHNGGWIGFGPDGYLYIATGDGGSGNDPSNRAQNLNELLGKMLRLDVDGADNIPGNDDDDGVIGQTLPPFTIPSTNPFFGPTTGRDEIWAYGLRNPWRPSFDRQTGDLFIADVGQNTWEEISFQPASSAGGENYGWRCMEGNHCTGLSGCTCQIGCGSGVLVCPIWEYSHGSGCSISGGYVYRGSAIPALQGTYFFADYCTAQIWTFSYSPGSGITNFMNRTAELAPGGGLSINSITSFGEDGAGELYICDRGSTTSQTGEVFKVIPGPPLNNNCINGTLMTDGATVFSTANATTDGPDEPGLCDFNGYTHIENDIWYRYVATCTGTARVSLCGATFNTKLAIYTSCPTGPGSAIACNDDFCGTASEVTFPATMNTVYRIRIGGFNGATGSGTMIVGCDDTQPCQADIDNSGSVDVADLLAVINAWGPCPGCPADIDNSGTVDVTDLLAVINGWGACP